MNEIEAIEILNSKYHIEGPIKIVRDELEARVIAVKALEKQVPKKPIEQQLNVKHDLIGLCPVCKEMWCIKYKEYCSNCGQKLDWSGEK